MPALQLVYEIVVKVKEGEQVHSLSAISDDAAYAAGVQIGADMRRLFAAATRRQLAFVHSKASGDPGSLPPVAPPLVFVHIAQMRTQVVKPTTENGMASQLANLSTKLALKISRWSAKRFAANPELVDIASKAVAVPPFAAAAAEAVTIKQPW